MAEAVKKFFPVDDVRAAAKRYGWPALLMRFGIDPGFLKNVHGPCPGCGGKDRFRFDDNEGEGTFICSQGGGDVLSGDGITLLMHAKRWEFAQCIRELGDFLEVKPGERPKAAPGPRPIESRQEKPKFCENSLQESAKRWRPYVSTAWLADRSAINPYMLSSGQFLEALYDKTREFVIIFTDNKTQGQAVWPLDTIPAGGPEGVWFLIQPVDGKVYPNPRNNNKPSRRSEEAVSSWRFLCLESDKADPRDWLGVLVQLELPISAIYTSGRRSVHALVRLDAESLGEWRDFSRSVMLPILTKLGADPQVLTSSVRLSRLPGCARAGRLQKLLYLNPVPEVKSICSLPRKRDVLGAIALVAKPYLPKTVAHEIISKMRETDADVNLKSLISRLEKEESQSSINVSRESVVAALDWFSTSPAARELLQKLNEPNQRNETKARSPGS
jgi:hypothetical protein